ncbi:mRNA interferase HigB [Methylococcales bacterium]|nr:mRNA interferase HigB [Methylococcales bacterium]
MNSLMRVIINKILKLFSQTYPQADTPLQEWRKSIESYRFGSYAELKLKQKFNSVDSVGDYYVFDIADNRYHLIAAIHFNTQILYVQEVLTHSAYNHWGH